MAAILGPLISDKKLNFEQYLLNTHWHYTLQIHGITLGTHQRCVIVIRLVGRVVLHIILHCVSNRELIILVILIMVIRVTHPVKGKRGHPLLVVILVVVLIVRKHKHSRTPLTNPLLHLVNQVRVKLMCHPLISIQPM